MNRAAATDSPVPSPISAEPTTTSASDPVEASMTRAPPPPRVEQADEGEHRRVLRPEHHPEDHRGQHGRAELAPEEHRRVDGRRALGLERAVCVSSMSATDEAPAIIAVRIPTTGYVWANPRNGIRGRREKYSHRIAAISAAAPSISGRKTSTLMNGAVDV